MPPGTRLQIIGSIITVRATERQTRGFVLANGSTVSHYNLFHVVNI